MLLGNCYGLRSTGVVAKWSRSSQSIAFEKDLRHLGMLVCVQIGALIRERTRLIECDFSRGFAKA